MSWCSSSIESESLLLALYVGIACLLLQGLLTALFATLLPQGWWQRQPGFLAHQIIALPLMIYVASVGTARWFSDRSVGTPDSRIYGRDSTSELLSAILLGELVFWDIPLTFLPTIYSPAAMGHHVGLAVLALIALTPYLQYYVPFFVGVIEISSIPLQVVDFFHPKHFADLLQGSPSLGLLNTVARALFILSFVSLRTLWFPYVVFARVFPDLLSLIPSRTDAASVAWLYMAMAFAVAFTGLQLYWSVLLVQQVRKALAKGGDAADAADADEAKESKERPPAHDQEHDDDGAAAPALAQQKALLF